MCRGCDSEPRAALSASSGLRNAKYLANTSPQSIARDSWSGSRSRRPATGTRPCRCRAKCPRRTFDHQRLLRLHAVDQRLHRNSRRRRCRGIGGRLGVRRIHRVSSELAGRNGVGKCSEGGAVPAGIGATISGVTITINSVLFFVRVIDWKNLPRIGMSPRNGIFSKLSVSVLSSRPPDHKALAIAQLHFGIHLARGDSRHLKP